MTTTLEQALTMPLAELRERVDLAERLALASRLTPSGAYAGTAGAVQPLAAAASPQPAPATETAAAKKKREAAEKAAAEAAKPSTTTTTTTTTTGGPSADDLMAAMTPAADADAGAELTLDAGDGTGGGAELSDDDMLAGFEPESTAELTVPQLREAITGIATDIQQKRDQNRLTAVRGLLQKYGVQRVGELPDDKLAAFYAEAKAV